MRRCIVMLLMFVGLAFMASGCADMTQEQVAVGLTAVDGAVKAFREAGGVVTVNGQIRPNLRIGLFEGVLVDNDSVFFVSAVFKPEPVEADVSVKVREVSGPGVTDGE